MMATYYTHKFYVEFKDSKGETLLLEPVEEYHLNRLLEDSYFSALCAGKMENDAQVFASSEVVISPRFGESGELRGPFINGVQVKICFRYRSKPNDIYKKDYGLEPFLLKAKEVLQNLLKEGLVLEKGSGDEIQAGFQPNELRNLQEFSYQFIAIPETEGDEVNLAPKGRGGIQNNSEKVFEGSVISKAPYPLMERSLEDFGLSLNPDQHREEFPVFVHESVVEEIISQTLQAGGLEQGGFLLGYLSRDPKFSKIYLVVTSQIPATEAVRAGRDSFTFLPESFFSVRNHLALRNSGEILVGWEHNHHFCDNCPNNSFGKTVFFSSADEVVQSSAFAHPFQVALVAGRDLDLDRRRPAVRLYGWKDAAISELRFVKYKPV